MGELSRPVPFKYLILVGNVTLVSDGQFANAYAPMVLTPFIKLAVGNPVDWNAPSPILSMLAGKSIVLSCEQPENA